MAGLSTAGGIAGYTFAGSVPSLAGGVGIGALMAVSAVRVHDNLAGGVPLAAASSVAMVVPMVRRAVATRGPIPIAMSVLATASAGYYAKQWAAGK